MHPLEGARCRSLVLLLCAFCTIVLAAHKHEPQRPATATATLLDSNQVALSEVTLSGSSTVLPIAQRWLHWFHATATSGSYQDEQDLDDELIGTSNNNYALGSSEGARRLCSGSVDIGSMSRQWKPTEATLEHATDEQPPIYRCTKSNIRVAQVKVALDGITVFVQRGGSADRCLGNTSIGLEHLHWIFTYDDHNMVHGGCKMWSDMPGQNHPDCKAQCIERWIPGRKSGTLKVFENTVNASLDVHMLHSNAWYNASEDDDVIMNGVMDSGNAIGFVGYGHLQKQRGRLSLVSVVHDLPKAFCMLTTTGINPLARMLYMNINVGAPKPAWDFLRFGFSDLGQQLVADAGFCRLPPDAVHKAQIWLAPSEQGSSLRDDTAEQDNFASGVPLFLAIGIAIGIFLSQLLRIYKPGKKFLGPGRSENQAIVGEGSLIGHPECRFDCIPETDSLVRTDAQSRISPVSDTQSVPSWETDSRGSSSAVEQNRHAIRRHEFACFQPVVESALSRDLGFCRSPTSSLSSTSCAPPRLIKDMSSNSMMDAVGQVMLNLCESIALNLSWSDVRELQMVASMFCVCLSENSASSSKEAKAVGKRLVVLLSKANRALSKGSFLSKACEIWVYSFPKLGWVANGALTAEKLVSLVWALGVLAADANGEETAGWHREMAAYLLHNRSQPVPWNRHSFYVFIHNENLPQSRRYCRWVVPEAGGYLDLQSVDLLALLMDLDPGTDSSPNQPQKAIECAQGLVVTIQIKEAFFAYPQRSWALRQAQLPAAEAFHNHSEERPSTFQETINLKVLGIEGDSSESSSVTPDMTSDSNSTSTRSSSNRDARAARVPSAISLPQVSFSSQAQGLTQWNEVTEPIVSTV